MYLQLLASLMHLLMHFEATCAKVNSLHMALSTTTSKTLFLSHWAELILKVNKLEMSKFRRSNNIDWIWWRTNALHNLIREIFPPQGVRQLCDFSYEFVTKVGSREELNESRGTKTNIRSSKKLLFRFSRGLFCHSETMMTYSKYNVGDFYRLISYIFYF